MLMVKVMMMLTWFLVCYLPSKIKKNSPVSCNRFSIEQYHIFGYCCVFCFLQIKKLNLLKVKLIK